MQGGGDVGGGRRFAVDQIGRIGIGGGLLALVLVGELAQHHRALGTVHGGGAQKGPLAVHAGQVFFGVGGGYGVLVLAGNAAPVGDLALGGGDLAAGSGSPVLLLGYVHHDLGHIVAVDLRVGHFGGPGPGGGALRGNGRIIQNAHALGGV